MPLSAEDQELVELMRQRETRLRRWRHAESLILFRTRRFRWALIVVGGLIGIAISYGVFAVSMAWLGHPSGWWIAGVINAFIGAALGVEVAQHLLRSRLGERIVLWYQHRLRSTYAGDLHGGRRWLEFYHERHNIGPYVPQVLRFLEEGRFDSVDEALAFAREHREENPLLEERALARFAEAEAGTNILVLSSADAEGRPSSRVMRFVTTERPGVWLVTCAPVAPKVAELDLGRVAVQTTPTAAGATISSNQVWIGRSALSFSQVAALYDEQVPGYTDGMSQAERDIELVYELTLRSAKIDSWLEHDVVDFGVGVP